jgi:hypothetical protein
MCVTIAAVLFSGKDRVFAMLVTVVCVIFATGIYVMTVLKIWQKIETEI